MSKRVKCFIKENLLEINSNEVIKKEKSYENI